MLRTQSISVCTRAYTLQSEMPEVILSSLLYDYMKRLDFIQVRSVQHDVMICMMGASSSSIMPHERGHFGANGAYETYKIIKIVYIYNI